MFTDSPMEALENAAFFASLLMIMGTFMRYMMWPERTTTFEQRMANATRFDL